MKYLPVFLIALCLNVSFGTPQGYDEYISESSSSSESDESDLINLLDDNNSYNSDFLRPNRWRRDTENQTQNDSEMAVETTTTTPEDETETEVSDKKEEKSLFFILVQKFAYIPSMLFSSVLYPVYSFVPSFFSFCLSPFYGGFGGWGGNNWGGNFGGQYPGQYPGGIWG